MFDVSNEMLFVKHTIAVIDIQTLHIEKVDYITSYGTYNYLITFMDAGIFYHQNSVSLF